MSRGHLNPDMLQKGQAVASKRGEQACRLITIAILLLSFLGWIAYGIVTVVRSPPSGNLQFIPVKYLPAPGVILCSRVPGAYLRCRTVNRNHVQSSCDHLIQNHWNLSGAEFLELAKPTVKCWVVLPSPFPNSPLQYFFDNGDNSKMLLQIATNETLGATTRYPFFFTSFETTSYFNETELCPRDPSQCLDKSMENINAYLSVNPLKQTSELRPWEQPAKRQAQQISKPPASSLLYKLQFSWLVSPNFGNVLFKRSERWTISKRFKVFGYNSFSQIIMGGSRKLMVNVDLSTIEFSGTERPMLDTEVGSLKRQTQVMIWNNIQMYPVKNPLNLLRSSSDSDIEGAGLPYQVDVFKEQWSQTMLTLLAGLGGMISLLNIVYYFLWGRSSLNPFGFLQRHVFRSAPLKNRYKHWWYRFWIPAGVTDIHPDDWVTSEKGKSGLSTIQLEDRVRRLEDVLSFYYLSDLERLDGNRIPEVLRGRGGLNALQPEEQRSLLQE
jgi:hypothetical protein